MNRTLPLLMLSVATVISLFAGCTEHELPAADDKSEALDISVLTSGATSSSRSIVSAIGNGAGEVGSIGVFLTAADGHSAYADAAISSAIFTYNGSAWSAPHAVNLQDKEARLYAWYPVNTNEETKPVDNGTTRTVAVSVPATQTFDGAGTTACSQADYLYGSGSSSVGDATPIMASATKKNPIIHLQHALAQVVFNLQYKPGRLPDATYDYVKSISLQGPFRAGDGTMQLNDGTLLLSNQTNATLTFKASSNPCLPGAVDKPVPVAYALVAPKAATTALVTMNMVLGELSNTKNDRTLSVTTTLFDVAWQKGYRYTYNILLDKNDLSFKEVTIGSWIKGTGSDSVMPPVWD